MRRRLRGALRTDHRSTGLPSRASDRGRTRRCSSAPAGNRARIWSAAAEWPDRQVEPPECGEGGDTRRFQTDPADLAIRGHDLERGHQADGRADGSRRPSRCRHHATEGRPRELEGSGGSRRPLRGLRVQLGVGDVGRRSAVRPAASTSSGGHPLPEIHDRRRCQGIAGIRLPHPGPSCRSRQAHPLDEIDRRPGTFSGTATAWE
jgi:hypothetical protein